MRLLNQLYTLVEQREENNNTIFRVAFNSDCFIYKVHFANNPITPGACLIQIILELFETSKGKKLSLKILKNVKFIAPINPIEHPEVDVIFENSEIENDHHLKVVVEKSGKVFAKISLIGA